MSEARRRGQARATKTLLLPLVVVAAFGMAVFLVFQRAAERLTGRVSATGTSVGSFAFVPNDCASGHAFVPGFFGADLRGEPRSQGLRPNVVEKSYDLRVVESGDEATLWLYPPNAKRGAIPIAKSDCTRWDVLVAWANITVNRVHTVNGHVHVTCRAGGGNLTADVDFERCAL